MYAGCTITLDDDAILVVAELGGAQPDGAAFFVDVPKLTKSLDCVFDSAPLMKVVLVEVDVEVDTEVVQPLLDLGEHQVDTAASEDLLSLGFGPVEYVRLKCNHLRGDLVDVLTGIAVVRSRLTLGPRHQRACEAIDLSTVIVEVVLARYVSPCGLQYPSQRVSDCGPPNTAHMHRAGRIGGHELKVDPRPAISVAGAVCRSGLDDGACQLAGGGGVETDVDEAGAGDVDGLDAW